MRTAVLVFAIFAILVVLILTSCSGQDDVPRVSITVTHELAAHERLVCHGTAFFIGLPTTSSFAGVILFRHRTFVCELVPATADSPRS